MTFPGGWWVVPLAADEIGPLLDLLGSQQPEVADLVRRYLDLSGARASIAALDTDPEHSDGGIPPNANVLIQPTGGLPLTLVAPVVNSAISQLPGVQQPITQESVALPAGDAVRFTFRVATTSTDGTASTGVLRTYLLTRGTNGFLVTFVTTEQQLARDEPTFDSIIGSFRFTD
jgi:hypothetical protein